jgi:hypothetical protein
MSNDCKYPNIEVELIGKDGNAFFILGTVGRALRRAKLPQEEIDQFYSEAMGSDYDELLRTCMRWVSIT